MKPVQLKLDRFVTYAKFQDFITHLESIPSIVNFVVVGGAVVLEYDAVETSKVYYYLEMDNVSNNPIITVGRDCEASRKLTDWDQEQLELKRIISWGV